MVSKEMSREIFFTAMIRELSIQLAITLSFTASMRRTRSISQVCKAAKYNFFLLLGIDGSEGITAITLSPSKKHLAICEKAERAICMIWDISGVS